MNEQQQPIPMNIMSTTESGHFSKRIFYYFLFIRRRNTLEGCLEDWGLMHAEAAALDEGFPLL